MKMQIALSDTAESIYFPLCMHNNKRPGETSGNGGSCGQALRNAVAAPIRTRLNQLREQKPTVNTVVPTTEGEAKPDAPSTPMQSNALSPVGCRNQEKLLLPRPQRLR